MCLALIAQPKTVGAEAFCYWMHPPHARKAHAKIRLPHQLCRSRSSVTALTRDTALNESR